MIEQDTVCFRNLHEDCYQLALCIYKFVEIWIINLLSSNNVLHHIFRGGFNSRQSIGARSNVTEVILNNKKYTGCIAVSSIFIQKVIHVSFDKIFVIDKSQITSELTWDTIRRRRPRPARTKTNSLTYSMEYRNAMRPAVNRYI